MPQTFIVNENGIMATITVQLSVAGNIVPARVVPASISFPFGGGPITTPPLQFFNSGDQPVTAAVEDVNFSNPQFSGQVNPDGSLTVVAPANTGISPLTAQVDLVTNP